MLGQVLYIIRVLWITGPVWQSVALQLKTDMLRWLQSTRSLQHLQQTKMIFRDSFTEIAAFDFRVRLLPAINDGKSGREWTYLAWPW